MNKIYGVFHINGFRSQNYPQTFTSFEEADKAIGENLTGEPLYWHRSRYVVRELLGQTNLGETISKFFDQTMLVKDNFMDGLNAHGLAIVLIEDSDKLDRVKKLFAELNTFGYEDVVARNIVKALRKALT